MILLKMISPSRLFVSLLLPFFCVSPSYIAFFSDEDICWNVVVFSLLLLFFFFFFSFFLFLLSVIFFFWWICFPCSLLLVQLSSTSTVVCIDNLNDAQRLELKLIFRFDGPSSVVGFYKTGHLFCFLPLAREVSESCLPVHINAPFALTSDRRGLLTQTEDDRNLVGGRSVTYTVKLTLYTFC